MVELTGKTVLITGATQGLGRNLTILFAKQGCNLILLGRNFAALELLDNDLSPYNVKTTLVPLDLNELDKIPQLGPQLAQRYQAIDIFIANAAMLGTLSPLTHQNLQSWQQLFNVNVHANWLLLQTLEPLLGAAVNPTVMVITTGLIQSRLPYWGGYAVSKAALEQMTLMYAQEKKSLGFKINCIDPGIMRTKLYETAMPGADMTKIPDSIHVAEKIVSLCQSDNLVTGQIIKTG